ncbi:hypothetical protein AB0J14_38290 [Micromonospora arborensis]
MSAGRAKSRTVLLSCGCYATLWGGVTPPATCGSSDCPGNASGQGR